MDLVVKAPPVDTVPELRSHEEGLDETVDVASGAYINQALITHSNYYEKQAAQEEGGRKATRGIKAGTGSLAK
jgi:hypothetical protein